MDPQATDRAAPEAASRADWQRATEESAGARDAYTSPMESFKEALREVGELKAYAGHYLAAKLDGIKVSLRNIAIYAILGIVGLIAAGAMIVTAVVLLCLGLAHALSDLLGDKYWAGDLIVGVLLLGGIAAGVIFGMKALTGTSLKRTVQKYETRLRDQRINYGHDARERAASQAREDG